ncbi:lung adenoma susceptibility protein 2 [Brachyhypopomus gauderio]|uniref:lung adenoma susceptibility protein 2 n=1 Tax=Brachyhypopomus gauderio TaxID=698409 RepID=UPI004041683A
MTSGDSLLSPESTITSLLSRSGRLRSSFHPEPPRTIKYKNRKYHSATEALEAYIADFQRSQHTSDTLELHQGPDKPHLLHPGYRNRDVLKESLTDGELDLLHLPAGPLHRASDHHSITTDDLLLLPCDGSLPVTRTSAALSRSGGHLLGCSINSNSWSHSRPGGDVKKPLHRCPAAQHTVRRAPSSGRERPLSVDDLMARSLTPQQGSPRPSTPLTTAAHPPACRTCHHLPRWITSHRSEMDFSGVTSIPDLRYPGWLRECQVSSGALAITPSVPSWVNELERNTMDGQQPRDHGEGRGQRGGHGEGRGQQGGEPATLQHFRLRFAETLAAAESGSSVWDEPQTPFQGNMIGCLIPRAEQALNSPSLGLDTSITELHSSPGDTIDLQEAERTWDNPAITFKSPVPVGGAEEQLTPKESQEDTRGKSTGSCSSGYSSRTHPGPVEALKHMLFNLQAVEQRVTQQEDTVPDPPTQAEFRQPNTVPDPPTHAEFRQPNTVPDPPTHAEFRQPNTVPDPPTQAEFSQMEEVGGEHESSPGGQWLKTHWLNSSDCTLTRALHHLDRLKSLVDEMGEKESRAAHVERSRRPLV